MDSLGRLSDTLPRGSAIESTEKELQTAFRQSALALTGLFKVGKKATTRAYIAGKQEALQDVLEFLQASLDHPQPPTAESSIPPGQLNVARLIDYICARQETLQAEEEGEQDDDEPPTGNNAQASISAANAASAATGATGGSSRTASSLFASRTAASSRPQSAPPSRPAATPAHASSSAPSSPPTTISTSTTPHFRNHPTSFRQDSNLFSQSTGSGPTSGPSSPLASGSTTPTTVASSRRRSAASNNSSSNTASMMTGPRRSNNKADGSSTTGSRPSSATGSRERDSSSTLAVEALASSVGSMKRRFHTVSMTDLVDLDGRQQDATSGVAAAAVVLGQVDEAGNDGDTNGEDMDMEMDGWDGVGERPPKRVLRTR